MSYFSKFPLSVFTVDDYASGQVLPDLLRRAKLVNDLVVQNAFFDQYDLVDNETPEITADIFYGDPTLHWLVLHANEILDPRFSLPLNPFFLEKYTEGKYANVNAVHHYEDTPPGLSGNVGNVVSATIVLTTTGTNANSFMGISNSDILTNNTNVGVGVIISKTNNQSVTVLTNPGNGGFISGDNIKSVANTSHSDITLSSTSLVSGVAVTNLLFEDRENDKKRNIKLLKPSVVGEIVDQFEEVIKQ